MTQTLSRSDRALFGAAVLLVGGAALTRYADINNVLAITDKTVFLNVVGVIHDLELAGPVEGNGPSGSYFFPLAQDASRFLTFAVRSATDPAAQASGVRSVISALDRELVSWQHNVEVLGAPSGSVSLA